MCGGAETRRGILSLVAAFLFCCLLPAAELNDGVDRSDPNFVKASLLVMGPGGELFSCIGHACLRLECPTFKLDNCFSYESERIGDRIWTFFKGGLKMGMFAIPTAEFLEEYRASGRGVTQYALNLPPSVKQQLWRLLDEEVARGADLPYDYIARGCAQSVLRVLLSALRNVDLKGIRWPEKYRNSRREIVVDVVDAPWTLFALQSIVGTDWDRAVPNLEKVVVPQDLLVFLQNVNLNGVPLAAQTGTVLLPTRRAPRPTGLTAFFSPVCVAILVLLFSIVNLFVRRPWLDRAFLALQALLGAFFTYLVVLSRLPGTTLNWLLVPFNLLPVVFWKWRRLWALPFVGVLLVWDAVMAFQPNRYTDVAYVVAVLAYLLFYLKFTTLPGLVRAQRSSHDA